MFLVRTEFSRPSSLDDAQFASLAASERARAETLQSEGAIRLLWREPGTTIAWGIWEATDELGVREAVSTLPLSPWMDIDIRTVIDHPNALFPPSETWSNP